MWRLSTWLAYGETMLRRINGAMIGVCGDNAYLAGVGAPAAMAVQYQVWNCDAPRWARARVMGGRPTCESVLHWL